jgi:hypothetical protein
LTLGAVVSHYGEHLRLNLTAQERGDPGRALKSL